MKYVVVEKTPSGLRKIDFDGASDLNRLLLQAKAALEGIDIDVIPSETWEAIPAWIKIPD